MSFDDLLKSLHQEYLSSLPNKIGTIREQMQTANPSELRESFHKLKGTGRTYGMPEVSELAAVVEEICSDYPSRAVTAVGHALEILHDIHAVRLQHKEFPLESDTRFTLIRKLLQN